MNVLSISENHVVNIMLLTYVKIYKYLIVYTREISIAFYIHVYVNIFAVQLEVKKFSRAPNVYLKKLF